MFTILFFVLPLSFVVIMLIVVNKNNKKIKNEEQERMKEAYKQAIKELEEEKEK